jgi:hypothetical protein
MVDPMSKEAVFELAGLLGRLPQDQANLLVAELRHEQPDIHGYLRALVRLFPDPLEYEQVFGIGVSLCKIMKHSNEPPGLVTLGMLRRAREAYAAEMARLTALQGEELTRVATQVVLSHPEPALLAYLVVALRQKADPPLSPDAYILAMKALRILLDALIASRAPTRRPAARPRSRRHPTGRA